MSPLARLLGHATQAVGGMTHNVVADGQSWVRQLLGHAQAPGARVVAPQSMTQFQPLPHQVIQPQVGSPHTFIPHMMITTNPTYTTPVPISRANQSPFNPFRYSAPTDLNMPWRPDMPQPFYRAPVVNQIPNAVGAPPAPTARLI